MTLAVCAQPEPFFGLPMSDSPAARPRTGSLNNSNASNRNSLFGSFLGKPATKQSRPQSTLVSPAPQQPFQPAPINGANEFGAAPRQSMQQEPPPLHGELKSAVNLTQAHARKVYASGPLVQRIERGADGNRPTKDEGWKDVWAQLSGTTLSVWDMKEVNEASKQNREVPPKYVNITDAFFHVLGGVMTPATETKPAETYSNVLTLNTAGANLFLFSAQTPASLISWVSALRLSSWEKSRLEEIYTAHLIRVVLSPDNKEVPTTLVKGRMEGSVRVRVSGQTDWKQLWMVISSANPQASSLNPMIHNGGVGEDGSINPRSSSPNTLKKSKVGSVRATMSMFGKSKPSQSFSAVGDRPLPVRSEIAFYAAPTPVKNIAPSLGPPVFTVLAVHQAFGVYPERPELITKSTLIKVEGEIYSSDGSMSEGWVMIMPEIAPGDTRTRPQDELLKYVVAIHDAFGMYGRVIGQGNATEGSYSWNPRDPSSLMFGYPVGAQKDLLFLDREISEKLDPREDRTRLVRNSFIGLLLEKMRLAGNNPASARATDGAPQLPQMSGIQDRVPLDAITEVDSPVSTMAGRRSGSGGGFGLGTGSGGGSGMSNNTTPGAAGVGAGMSSLGPMVGSPEPIAEEPDDVLPVQEQGPSGAGMLNRQLTDSPKPDLPNEIAQSPQQQPPPPQDTEAAPISIPEQLEQAGRSQEYAPNKPLPGPNRYASDQEQAPLILHQQPLAMQSQQPPLSPNRMSMNVAIGDVAPLSLAAQRVAPLKPIQPNRPIVSTTLSPADASKDQAPVSAMQDGSLFDEAGAMYYMQHLSDGEQPGMSSSPSRQLLPSAAAGLTLAEDSSVKRSQTNASAHGPDPMYTASRPPMPQSQHIHIPASQSIPTHGSVQDTADAMAALSYLDRPPDSPTRLAESSDARLPFPKGEKINAETGNGHAATSSFAPSKQATERKARTQAQQADRFEATHKPGRSGKRNTERSKGAWASSDEEEEEDEDEEENQSDHDVDLEGNASQIPQQQQPPMTAPTPVRPLQTRLDSPVRTTPQKRMTRDLPQPPPGINNGMSRSTHADLQPSEAHNPRQTYYDGQTQLRMQSEHLQPGSARQNMWSQVLDPGMSGSDFDNHRSTFVQVEPQSEMMTKAFTPHGLLSAGLQDKQERSAKEQEKIARETGASLINVPNKPPPPQTGLLGAITAHERERKREGGMGATLTDREREKRNAEERQRMIDDHQRNQLEMMQNGSQYGAHFNPMAMNPMMNPMMAMNPYMMGMMGPGMMSPGMMTPSMGGGQYPQQPAFNPAHMYAAQAAAAAAYQQAMYTFSQAGSVVGENDAAGGSRPTSPPMHAMMSGGGAPFAPSPMMMDPRMSFFQPGMGMGMGMGMGIPQQHSGSTSMQHSGGQFDTHFSPNNLQPPGAVGQNSSPNSRNSSPGVTSPLPRS